MLQRAIKLDPNFASAYALLGIGYENLGEHSLASENMEKAFKLRERVSEFEKLGIEAEYYLDTTGNLEKARQANELWAQTYPRASFPPVSLRFIYSNLGQYDKALVEAREALRLDAFALNYANLTFSYIYLNRLEEARTTAEEAQAKNLDSSQLRVALYTLAFLQNDAAGMAREVAWAAGRPGVEDVFLMEEAYTAAHSGQVMKARDFTRRATASAERVEEKETAASYEAAAALREALFGNAAEAKQMVGAALGLSTGRDVIYGTALALALGGGSAQAQTLANDLAKGFPEDTIVQFNYLPTLRAQLALNRNDASNAIDVLQAAVPYELGSYCALCPAYVRGQAYLSVHQGSEATAEFQKILTNRGIVVSDPIGVLAHLQIGRGYAMQGDTAKARAAYQDFLTLWKDADPDIPILKQAKAEYAKLN
jgi:tetratricopeptide (TPR) repeat protein